MATRATLTVEDVLGELDGNEECESDSEDEFDGYVDTGERTEEVEPVVEEQMEVGANVEVGSQSGSDDDDTLQPGCPVHVEGNRPLHYFSLLVTEDMLQNTVTQTNLHVQQYIANNDIPPHSRVRRWSKSLFDVDELRRFFAIVILMGLVRYPQIESHWTVLLWPFTNTHCSNVSAAHNPISRYIMYTLAKFKFCLNPPQIMKRDRFTLILRFLHLNDNRNYKKRGEPGHDPLFKLRPFLEPLIAHFQQCYTLSKKICVDETMIGFKGRLIFIQYMPKKPTKWGLKA